jgi:hypothetical protein
VLGVVDHPLALGGQEGDRVGDHAQVLLGVDAHDLLQVQRPGLADERADGREGGCEQPQRRVLVGAGVAPARHAERAHVGREALAREALEQLLLLRVRGREAGLDEGDAEVVEQVRDAHLLLGRERHPLPLHPVAQGGVVDLDRGHEAGAGAGTTSSQWA